MKKIASILLLLFTSIATYAQVGGGILYDNNKNYSNDRKIQNNVSSTDSTMTVNVNILLNKEADSYMLTLSASEEAGDAAESIQKINKRIDRLIAELQEKKVKTEDVYVDFISQTKIYDFQPTVSKNGKTELEEVNSGFEVKKNIIIRLDNLAQVEEVIVIASQFDIYNVVKVDYINNDLEKIYAQLFDEAYAIGEQKLAKYISKTKNKVEGNVRIFDSFYSIPPKNSYWSFSAYESSDYDKYSTTVSKTLRKDKTFYYSGQNYSGFDKVINNTVPQVGIQYVLYLQLIYKIDKNF